MGEFVNVQNYQEEIEQYMPKFVFYRRGYRSPVIDNFGIDYSEKDSKVTDCYCTACHTRYTDSKYSPKNYKHKKDGICSNCGSGVEFRQMDRGRATYYFIKNFAVFEGAGDLMRIDCIRARQEFIGDELEPEIHSYSIARYELRPGKAVQFKCCFKEDGYKWIPKKTRAIEPNFASGFWYRDSNYTLINHEAVEHSFLRYLFKNEIDLPALYIQWLCRYAEHPQLEYFLHGGLPIIARKYVEQSLHYDIISGDSTYSRIRFNWKSNDLKKILHLTKPELEYFIETSGDYYASYIKWRKDFFRGKTPAETVKYFSEFKGTKRYIEEIEQKTSIDRKKIMDYALKRQNNQGTTFFLICYRDYINECVELKYDMQSTAITMPKDMFAMHERTSQILRSIRDKEENAALHKSDKKRQGLEVTDFELGLVLRLPRSIREISDEGASLNHCVGGYAERHANGKLTIMFLRTLSHPETPYYTMEVANDLHIVQCRGYRNNNANNPKPEEIIEFEKRYTEYLAMLKSERKRAQKNEKKKMQKAKAAA